jgi:hypothetical protein
MAFPVVSLLLLLLLSGCAATESDVGIMDDDETIKFLVADDDEGFTRGAYQAAKNFTEYAIYSFNCKTGRIYVANIVQTKQPDGSWNSSRAISYPGKNAVDFYALKPGFVRDDVKELTMTPEEKSFVHTLPNTNAKQTDFMISSLFNKTKEESGSSLLFKFKHLFSYLRFQGKCSVEGLNVRIRSFTIHNIKSTGKFTFSMTKEKDGSWELRDEKDNYTYLLPEERELTSKNAMLHTTDSMLFVMSQTPSIFAIADNTSFADADANGETYLEVECRIWKMEDDGVTPQYIGCAADTWAKVYYPMGATTKWQTTSSPYSGTYNVILDYTGGYTYEGEDFLKKHTNGTMQMVSLEPVQCFLVTNPWEDDDYNSQTIEMK